MDIKSKNNRKKVIILAFILITLLSAMVVSWYPNMRERISSMAGGYIYEREDVLTAISKNNYMLLKKSVENRMQKRMTVKEVFFPSILESNDFRETEIDIENIFEQWETNDKLINLDYYIFDNQRQISDTNTANNLGLMLNKEVDDRKELFDTYGFCAVISYNKNSMMTVKDIYGASWEKIASSMEKNTLISLLEKDSVERASKEMKIQLIEESPADFTIVYGIPKRLQKWDVISSFESSANYYGAANSGITTILIGIMSVVVIFALILGGKKIWYKENGILAKIPFEVNGFVLSFIAIFILDSWSVIDTIMNEDIRYIIGNGMTKTFYVIMSYGNNVLLWMCLLGGIFITVSSLKQIFIMGPVMYMKKRTIIGNIYYKIKKFIISLTEIDLTEKSDKIILKYILFNFVIMAIMLSIWMFGFVLLVPYSIFLFYFFRKFFVDLKGKYASILKVTSKIAEGNFNVEIIENLGVFEPLKVELEDIKKGFRKAVEEEVKSQKMKTELITNVSHDLKTPLTAIITYVDLLKGDQITEEERKSYIDTLDRKSQRLKTLIEDLFEVSKADSKNIRLDVVNVDVIALMKQTQFEMQDRIEEHGLDFRWNVSNEKIILALDSQKTFRIFENLISNTVKYALPDSRVYIDVCKQNEEIIIVLKNISKEELNIGAEEITERFIRGDRARNTEGSGLGLSIARSFVELQGGTFQIVIDGDLFKAVIKFNQKDM